MMTIHQILCTAYVVFAVTGIVAFAGTWIRREKRLK
jgi:hypothetical protein